MIAIDDSKAKLRELVQAITSAVERRKAEGKIVLERRSYFLRPDLSLHYTPDLTITNDLPVQVEEEELWNRHDLAEFISREIEVLPGFEELAGDPQRRALLVAFVWAIAADVAKGSQGSVIDGHVETLLADLAGGAREYKVKIWLSGVEPVDNEIRVSSNLTLRRPSREDLQERVDARWVHFAHALRQPTNFSCIADMRVRGSRPLDVQGAVDRFAKALGLFRLGAVGAPRYEWSCESFGFMNQGGMGRPLSGARLSYRLTRENAGELADFLTKIVPQMPTDYGASEEAPDFFSTALRWYEDALLRLPMPYEGSIAAAVACLEALFSRGETEVLYKLQMRVAGFLRHFGFNPLEVRVYVKRAYEVRSKYVHGEPSKKTKRADLPSLFESVCDYARVGLLAVA